jgi:hypothetical protein
MFGIRGFFFLGGGRGVDTSKNWEKKFIGLEIIIIIFTIFSNSSKKDNQKLVWIGFSFF